MSQGTNDGKTAPTVVSIGATSPTYMEFKDNVHRGHKVTRVGTFNDGIVARPYEVFYCQTDHTLGIA